MICSCGCLVSDVIHTDNGHYERCRQCKAQVFYPALPGQELNYSTPVMLSYGYLFSTRHSRNRPSGLDSGESFGA